MLKPYTQKISKSQNLTFEESKQAIDIIMNGKASHEDIVAFLNAMNNKGETIDEIAGFAIKMREHAIKIKKPDNVPVIDTCGTGGDKKGTFNISTISAFVAAGAGVAVAKHGNRGVSSPCGSADILKSLGVNIDIPVKKVEECLHKVGIAFLFAPNFHPAMKYAAGPRRELGKRTFFNILGPLTNPAFVDRQVIGVYSKDLLDKMANVLKKMGAKKAIICHSKDGMDEISLCDDTYIAELTEKGKIKNYILNPEDYGFKKVDEVKLKGGNILDNTKIALDILNGKKGPKTDVVILNAGAAIYVSGVVDSIKEGINKAQESIESGAARGKLEDLVRFTT